MGNSQKQLLPTNYHDHCHPELTSSSYDQPDNQLQLAVHSIHQYNRWRQSLYPILSYTKHLFLPIAFRENQFNVPKCCSKQQQIANPIRVCYQPYIYTLKNQIIARKLNGRHFRQYELWKIIKCGILSLRDWQYAYPDIQIGNMIPQNFVINSQGLMKFVTRYSFISQNHMPIFLAYIPPENRKNAIIRYTLRKQNISNKNTLASIYSLGIIILQMVSLHQGGLYQMPTVHKKKMLDGSPQYNKDIKQLVLSMTQDDINLRPSLIQIQYAVRNFKELCKQKTETLK